MQIRHLLLDNPITRPALRNSDKYRINPLNAIVLHWTANKAPSANAYNHFRYFNNTKKYTSPHFVVDEKEIIQLIPITEVAYHVGAKKYTPFGQSLKEKNTSPNYTSIAVEMCVNKGSDFKATYNNTIILLAQLLIHTGLYTIHITNHNKITGKSCPQWPDENNDFSLVSDEQMNILKQNVEKEIWSTRFLHDIII